VAARRILFAIRSPEAARQPGLAKAIQAARALGARLELFQANCDPVFIELARSEANAVDALRERVEGEVRIPLVRLCEAVRRHGVACDHSVAWDYPPAEAVVRRAQAIDARLVIADWHRGGRTQPWLIHLTDWELLRLSPVPVLLLRDAKPWRRPRVLAAVDPAHARAKPAKLDARIVAAATRFSQGLRGSLHLLHANHPSIVGLEPPKLTTWSTLSYPELKEQTRRAFEEFRSSAGIPRPRAHLVEGNPAVEIPRAAQQLRAGIVVMGAVSRSGLKRVFIGNTAERILDALTCDVLVVKPANFVSEVVTQPRGMRVSAPSSAVVY
jgi:universal stress protein E